MSITLEQAKSLRYGDILLTVRPGADGAPQKWRVNGRVKTWVRSPGRVRVPLKRGLYDYGFLTEHDLGLVSLDY